MNEQDVIIHIEALLFTHGGSIAKKDLAKTLGVTPEEIALAVTTLSAQSVGRGIVVVDDGLQVELRTAPGVSQKIDEIRKEEFSRDIGRAGLEVLAAVLYRGPLTRAEIDFIRGVNSSQTIRTLLMRGFVRKVSNPKDERSFLYEPTTEILSQLGVVSLRDLPEYEQVRAKLHELEEAYKNKQSESEADTQSQ